MTRALRVVVAVPITLAAVLGAAYYWLGHRGAVPDRNAPIPTCQENEAGPGRGGARSTGFDGPHRGGLGS